MGGLRIARFAKNLPLFGWQINLLTIKEKYLKEKDTQRLYGLNHVKIIRTVLFPTLAQLYLRLKNGSSHEKPHNFFLKNNLHKSAPRSDEKLSRKLKRYIISLLIALPDSDRNWILPATFHAVREIKRENINCIITTSPPVSVNLVGLLVKLITGVKWVADFRDPWLNEAGSKRLHPTSALSLKIESYLEKKVIQKADSVFTTTDNLRDKFREQYNDLSEKKFITVYNGFEKSAFSCLSNEKKYKKFTLTYAGTLYLGRTPEPIFKAINRLIRQKDISPDQVCIKLIGNCDNIDGVPTSEMIHAYGLGTVVEVLKPVPYTKVLEIISKSHIAMLFAPNQPMQIPAKLFDYIGAGTPVLALAEPGATADLVNTKKVGKAFAPDDIKSVANFILRSIENINSPPCHSDDTRTSFEIESIMKGLNDHLNTIVFPDI